MVIGHWFPLAAAAFVLAAAAAAGAEPAAAPAATPPPYKLFGKVATEGQLPFAVWLDTCTASIIDNRTLLTAAHCICLKKHPRGLIGAVDAFHLTEHSHRIELDLDRQFMHPKYPGCGIVGRYDVAIIKTKTVMKFNKYVNKIDLCQYGAKPGDLITIAGFGRDENRHFGLLKFVTNKYIRCHRYRGSICQSMALNTPYYGDSGGPLFEHEPHSGRVSQIGVVSGGDFLFKEAVYSSVCNNLKWIKSHMEH